MCDRISDEEIDNTMHFRNLNTTDVRVFNTNSPDGAVLIVYTYMTKELKRYLLEEAREARARGNEDTALIYENKAKEGSRHSRRLVTEYYSKPFRQKKKDRRILVTSQELNYRNRISFPRTYIDADYLTGEEREAKRRKNG